MKQGDLFMIVAGAVAIAGITSYLIAPKVETAPVVEVAAATPAKTIASATVDTCENTQETRLPANAAVLRQKNDSHYWGLADVDGFPVNFMVDTGASVVVLTYEDAKRLRLKPETLDYKWKISTAGGETKGASVLLKSIRFGGVEIENVEAMILREGLEQNLLGMSFLQQLYSYEFRGSQLIIRQ